MYFVYRHQVSIRYYSLSDTCTTALDICFLVDSSGSIRDQNPPDKSYDNWELILQFITDFIEDGRIKIGPSDVQVGPTLFHTSGLNTII